MDLALALAGLLAAGCLGAVGCTSGRDALWTSPEPPAPYAEGCAVSAGRSDAGTPPATYSAPAEEVAPHDALAIQVIADGGVPVPGVRLVTPDKATYVTDENGLVAYYEPDAMGRRVYFSVDDPRFDTAPDNLGFRGAALEAQPGGTATLSVRARMDGSEADLPAVDDLATRTLAATPGNAADCFGLQLRDAASGRGVPLALVEDGRDTYVSDSQGLVAYCAVDRVGTEQTFVIDAHGYRFAPSEVTLVPEAGQHLVLELSRDNLAERLYRTTGTGIYRDSELLGRDHPVQGPGAHAVASQDLIGSVRLGERHFWLFGDTLDLAYPLANMWGSAAFTPASDLGAPAIGFAYSYVGDAGERPAAVGQGLPPENLATWFETVFTLDDDDGEPRAVTAYVKPRGDLSAAARGLALFDEDQQSFEHFSDEPTEQDSLSLHGQSFQARSSAGAHTYFPQGLRIGSTLAELLPRTRREVFTALQGTQLQTDDEGHPQYAWRAGESALAADELDARGVEAAYRLTGHLRDTDTGLPLAAQGPGSVAYNPRRGRFSRVFLQRTGSTSFLGELWYAEGDSPVGPWVYARKILSHDRYSFLRPIIHPHWLSATSPYLYFEGTFSQALSGAPPLPRYERNQVLYRLNLDAPALAPPVPVYAVQRSDTRDWATAQTLRAGDEPGVAMFYALDRAAPGFDAVYWSGAACEPRRLRVGPTPSTPPVFYAPSEMRVQGDALIDLLEVEDEPGQYRYTTTPGSSAGTTLAQVWRNPVAIDTRPGDFTVGLRANAGPDRCVDEAQPGRGARVTLRATSQGAAGTVSYAWQRADAPCTPLGSGERLTLLLGVGLHVLTLQATDADGNRARDHVMVRVSPSGS